MASNITTTTTVHSPVQHHGWFCHLAHRCTLPSNSTSNSTSVGHAARTPEAWPHSHVYIDLGLGDCFTSHGKRIPCPSGVLDTACAHVSDVDPDRVSIGRASASASHGTAVGARDFEGLPASVRPGVCHGGHGACPPDALVDRSLGAPVMNPETVEKTAFVLSIVALILIVGVVYWKFARRAVLKRRSQMVVEV